MKVVRRPIFRALPTYKYNIIIFFELYKIYKTRVHNNVLIKILKLSFSAQTTMSVHL